MTTASKYTPIWEKLKATGKCSITAPAPLHKRIIKAVIKRKYIDLAFHYQMAEKGKNTWLTHHKQGSVIHFTLHSTINEEDL